MRVLALLITVVCAANEERYWMQWCVFFLKKEREPFILLRA